MLHQNNDPSVTITLDLFTVSLLLASLLFLFCLVLAKRKYTYLKRANGSQLDTKKLLVLSAATACFLRIMSFVGVVAMDIANVRAHYTLKPTNHHHDTNDNGSSNEHNQQHQQQYDQQHPQDKNQSFYDASMTILFDLPNAIVISTYILLTLVWAECSLLSRFHTESSVSWRKKWLIWYTIFNSILYATQVILYILIFVSGGGMESSQVVLVRNVVNVAMAGINLSAVFLVFCLYIYLNVSFSGFPFRSQTSRESLRKITNVMLFWSLTRIIWGISMLIIYMKDVDLLSAKGWEPFMIFVLLVLCEIAPIIVLMDYSFITIFEFEGRSTREMSSLASGRHVIEGDAMGGAGGSGLHRGNDEITFTAGDGRSSRSYEEPLLGENASSSHPE